MDGLSTNLAACRLLGCSYQPPTHIQSFFISPSNGLKIYIILDACHMIKLVRNLLGDYKILSYDNKLIKWEFIEKLYNYQSKCNIKLSNKLTKKHIYYKDNIMKVKLAVQVLSNSVAKSLELLTNFNDFYDVQPTVDFLIIINNIFDILNSRRLYDRNYKSALNLGNLDNIINYLYYAKSYLLSLKDIQGKSLYCSKR